MTAIKKIIKQTVKVKPYFLSDEEWLFVKNIFNEFNRCCEKNKLGPDKLEWYSYVIKINLLDIGRISDDLKYEEILQYVREFRKHLLDQAIEEEEYEMAYNLNYMVLSFKN